MSNWSREVRGRLSIVPLTEVLRKKDHIESQTPSYQSGDARHVGNLPKVIIKAFAVRPVHLLRKNCRSKRHYAITYRSLLKRQDANAARTTRNKKFLLQHLYASSKQMFESRKLSGQDTTATTNTHTHIKGARPMHSWRPSRWWQSTERILYDRTVHQIFAHLGTPLGTTRKIGPCYVSAKRCGLRSVPSHPPTAQ